MIFILYVIGKCHSKNIFEISLENAEDEYMFILYVKT